MLKMFLNNSDYKLLFSASPDVYLVMDSDFRVVAANKAHAKATLSQESDLLGKKIWDAFPEQENESSRRIQDLRESAEICKLTKAPHKMPIQKYDIPIPGSSEMEERYWSAMNIPVLDENNELKFIIHRVDDITESEKLRKINIDQAKALREFTNQLGVSKDSINQVQNLLNSVAAGIWSVDIDGIISFVNSAGVEILGYDSPEDLVGKNAHQLVHYKKSDGSPYHFHDCNLMKCLTEGKLLRLEDEVLWRKNGDKIHVDLQSTPLYKDGQLIGAVTSFNDVTKSKIDRDLLRESEERIRLITDCLPAFVSFKDTDHRYRFVNSTYSEWFQRPIEEIIGRTSNEILGVQEVNVKVDLHELAAFSGEYQAFEAAINRPDGKTIDLDIEYLPVFDPETGKVRGIISVGLDVTARKKALTESENIREKIAESQARYQSLADSLPNMMWTSDSEGNVNYANNRCLVYTGMSNQQKFGQGWIATIHPEDIGKMGPAWMSSMQSGQPFKMEYRIRRHDGEYRWFLGQAIPVLNSLNQIQYWIGAATDIHDEKRIAEELQIAKNLAENANITKTAFLANMSHEIRTPLGAILGFSELLKDASLSKKDHDHYVDIIARNGHSLTRIIDDILDLAKVEAGHMETEEIEFSLPELLSEVNILFADKAKQKNLSLEFKIMDSVPHWIASDPTRLRQILINIVGNAVKFTDQGHINVIVDASSLNEQNLNLSITVKDTGRGITPSQRERLFQPFTQADNSTTRRYGGTGLGLALSRRLAEALGGNVALADTDHTEGTTFCINLTVKKPTQNRIVEISESKSPALDEVSTELALKDVNVLLVDDSLDNQYFVKCLLNGFGAQVDVGSNGEEAVKMALDKKYDVVLMDIQMPEMDGYQALASLQKRGYQTPIVALTAHALIEERNRTKEAGFSAHLTKPVRKSELLSMLKGLT